MSRLPAPPPDDEDRARLDHLAELMIAEAVSSDDPDIFSASGFARENISILHQQVRCTNLAWALDRTGRVGPGGVVAIVGGSFSGLMLATALAIASDAIVYVFEKECALLPRYRDKGHRHLSPNLNTRWLGPRFDPSWSDPEFRAPVFAWRAGRASDVAAEWLREFERYDPKLPIFVLRGTNVSRRDVRRRKPGLGIDVRDSRGRRLNTIPVDLVIDASGFGEEYNRLQVPDFSYWESGHRLIYDHLASPAEVIVSGCGDSGVIEGLHYAIRDFRHEAVEALWPAHTRLEAWIDESLPKARLDDVLKRSDVDDVYGGQVLSELCWWIETRENLARFPPEYWQEADHRYVQPILRAIERALMPQLGTTFRGRRRQDLTMEEREAFAEGLPLDFQLEVRKAVRPVADAWISRRIAKMAHTIPLGRVRRVLHDLARPGVRVILNGDMPTAYTRQLSPYNVWLMRLLLSFPTVSYRQGRIEEATLRKNRRWDVAFEGGDQAVVDRVITRYGPRKEEDAGIARTPARDTQAGDWLLSIPSYTGPDPSDPSRRRRVQPAREAITARLDEVEARRGDYGLPALSKWRYVQRLFLGPRYFPPEDWLYADPQAWLSGELRDGRRPAYDQDVRVERALKR